MRAQALTARISDAAKAAAQPAGRPSQYLVSPDTNKAALAREIAAHDHVQRGLVAVFSTVEPCTAVSVRGDRERRVRKADWCRFAAGRRLKGSGRFRANVEGSGASPFSVQPVGRGVDERGILEAAVTGQRAHRDQAAGVPLFPLTSYFEAGMELARYEKLEDGSFSGEIPKLPGVVAFGATLRGCERELRSTVEDWVLVGLRLGHRLPKLAGIDLNKRPHGRVASAKAA